MGPDEHYVYFENIYNRRRREILNSHQDDRWLRKDRIVIQFGDGIKGMEEKTKQIRIMLSDIFLIACELQASAEKSLDGIDEQFSQGAGGKDLIRPNILLLHLMRIFYHLNDSQDKKQLGIIVTQLEKDLGVANKTVGSEPWNSKQSQNTQESNKQNNNGGGLSGLFNLATNMMEKMGYTPPNGMKAPTEDEISSVINTVFNNETTQNAIQGMFKSLQGCQDFGSAIQTVVQNVADPKIMEEIQGSVVQTAQMANQTQTTTQTQTNTHPTE